MHGKVAEVWPVVWNIPFAHNSRLQSWFLFILIYICGKIFCTRYLFVCLYYTCKVVMQISGLSVKSWSPKGLMLGIFNCSVECIFCSWKFGICAWPICAKIRLPADSLSFVPCNCCEMYTAENMFCSISDSYVKLQNSFCPNP